MKATLNNCKSIKKFVRLASVTFVALAIYGCSSTEEEIDKEQAIIQELPQLMLNEIASMAELDAAPLGENLHSDELTENIDPSNNIEEDKTTDTLNNQQSTSPKKHHNDKVLSRSSSHYFPKIGLHIAMFEDINSVALGWQYLQSILPADLINKTPLIARVIYEDTEYYSLRIGPFKSANSAKIICLNLQQQQHYCSVVEYKGLSFN
ncbi:hypothetical protein CXF85_20030 [Colwellia sp. 75C3]|uniref:hypothetical protein n=1 Tax=Colwellia sp. 75C3 TaxID=888425 RepID=UPI000C32D4A7|nr:hypothetical protein [Colwellia sp. 75C3]PKG81052.1 hypothetical protein CXF85_20030 [Colwellia sp. 75C3]